MLNSPDNIFDGLWVDTSNPANRLERMLDGCVSWWKVLEGLDGGKFLYDLIGNNHGTLTNGPLWSSAMGRPGGSGSLSFDGIDDYVSVPNSSTLNVGTGAYTISLWYNSTDTNQRAFVEVTNSLGSFAPMIGIRLGRLTVGDIAVLSRDSGGSGAIFATSAAYNDGRWHHVTVTRDVAGTLHTIYVDGLFRASQLTAAYGNPFGSLPIRFGSTADPSYLAGKMDDVCWWTARCLSASEVFALYQATRQQYDPRLNYVGWPMVAPVAGGGVTYNETGSGGIVLGGLATVQATYYTIGSGSLTLAGTIAPQVTYNPAPSGGLVLAGSATVQETCNVSTAGGIVLDGTAGVSCTYNAASSGGVILGGVADVSATYNVLANEDGNGELAICKAAGGQLAIVQCVYNVTGDGGVVLGGAADVSGVYSIESGGGIVIGGAADVSGVTAYNEVGSGGIVLGGTATVLVIISGSLGPMHDADWLCYEHTVQASLLHEQRTVAFAIHEHTAEGDIYQ